MNQGLFTRTTSVAHLNSIAPRNHARPERIPSGSRFSLERLQNGSRAPTSAAVAPARQRLPLQVFAAVKKSSSRNVACSKTLVILPGKEAEAETMCKKVVDFSKQRMSDRSNGIISFECSKDENEGTILYHFWEVYESNSALGRHNTTPEVETFMKRIQPLVDGPVGMALYEMKNGQLGAVSVQGGPRGEGGLDDATGATGAAGGASYKQTSGVVDLTNVEEEEDRGLWGMKFDMPWLKLGKKDKK